MSLGDMERICREVRAAHAEPTERVLSIELREGKKRQIRRMCEALGLRVTRLVRVAFGPLTLGRLRPGAYRPLDAYPTSVC